MPRGQSFTPFEQGTAWGLYKHAHWPLQRIADSLGTTKGSISSLLSRLERAPRTPMRRGRPPVLTTRKRRRLVDRLTRDAFHRRLTIERIAEIEDLSHDNRTLRDALLKEGYSRYIARKKPFLTDKHKADRLRWAYEHLDWSDRQWAQVLWTDEASIRCGLFGQVYVTRKADEALHEHCLIPRFRKYSACMIWACINSDGARELSIFDQGKVNGDVYRTKIIPLIKLATQKHQQASVFQDFTIVMQDNASIHRAKATLSLFLDQNINLMWWPANSPDLNPIENLWSLLKHRVGLHLPKTRDEVIQAVLTEWQALVESDILRICQSMKERCLAVIEAEGGHTKW